MTMNTSRNYTLIRHFDVPVCEELARLGGIRQDMYSVLNYCSALESFMPAPINIGQPLVIWDGVSKAAVITYARCFTTGVRRKLDEKLLLSAPLDLQEMHSYLMGIRSKHIAHSVNAFEDNTVMIEFSMKGVVPQNVVSVDTRSHQRIAIGDDEVPRLRQLTEWLLNKLSPLYEAEANLVLQEAAKLPSAGLLKLGIAPRESFLNQGSLLRKRSRQ